MKLKVLFAVVLLVVIMMWTKDMQDAAIDTRLFNIPAECLDANQDGFYNNLDFNYGGINIYSAEDKSFMLMDKKGAASMMKSCSYQPPAKISIEYLTDTDCIGYCRLFAYLKHKSRKV